jgi:hypothetical protein
MKAGKAVSTGRRLSRNLPGNAIRSMQPLAGKFAWSLSVGRLYTARMFKFWRRRSVDIPTLLHFTHVKAGSTWFDRLLHQLLPGKVRPRLGAELFSSEGGAQTAGKAEPLSYDALYRALPYEAGRVYPGLFLTRDEFLTRPDFAEASRFVVIRDLRDTLVSQYFSLKESHPLDSQGQVSTAREALHRLDKEQGLLWVFEREVARLLDLQRSWVGANEIVVRYEELILGGTPAFEHLFIEKLALPVAPGQVRKACEASNFERVFGRRLGQIDEKSHGRQGLPGDWKNHFTPLLCKALHERIGDLLIVTGYERDAVWAG